MKRANAGFTLTEVLVAITILGIGIVALVGSSGMVTRMIGRGKMETRAAQAAQRQIEVLRLAASSTSPRCTAVSFASGGPTTSGGVTISWTVGAAGSSPRVVTVTVSYATAKGTTHTDVLTTRIEC